MSAPQPAHGLVTARLMADARGTGLAAEWLRFIWAMNEAEPGLVGRPDFLGPWWAGGAVEEYPDVRVIHRVDPTVSICAKTERGARAIVAAGAALGVRVQGAP